MDTGTQPSNLPPAGLSRRRFLELLGLGVPVSVALAACSSNGPSQAGAGGGGGASSGGGGGSGSATYWFLNGEPQQQIRENAVKAFNATGNGTLNMWQMTSSSTADGTRTTLNVGSNAGQSPGISAIVNLPDPSITIISSVA